MTTIIFIIWFPPTPWGRHKRVFLMQREVLILFRCAAAQQAGQNEITRLHQNEMRCAPSLDYEMKWNKQRTPFKNKSSEFTTSEDVAHHIHKKKHFFYSDSIMASHIFFLSCLHHHYLWGIASLFIYPTFLFSHHGGYYLFLPFIILFSTLDYLLYSGCHESSSPQAPKSLFLTYFNYILTHSPFAIWYWKYFNLGRVSDHS